MTPNSPNSGIPETLTQGLSVGVPSATLARPRGWHRRGCPGAWLPRDSRRMQGPRTHTMHPQTSTDPIARRSARSDGLRLGAIRRELRLALLSEFGARAALDQLGRLCRNRELARVLEQVCAEINLQIDELQELLLGLGDRPPRRSLRRRLLAGGLTALSLVVGLRFALRVCVDASRSAWRGYHAYAAYFASHGEGPRARTCAVLSNRKRQHAQVLETWVQHGARDLRGGEPDPGDPEAPPIDPDSAPLDS